jgi:hypothetical protein
MKQWWTTWGAKHDQSNQKNTHAQYSRQQHAPVQQTTACISTADNSMHPYSRQQHASVQQTTACICTADNSMNPYSRQHHAPVQQTTTCMHNNGGHNRREIKHAHNGKNMDAQDGRHKNMLAIP